jgi:very-short-patch-repair endonuclease
MKTQEEAYEIVLHRCEEINSNLLKNFIYIGSKKTFLNLKCNLCKYEWSVSYNSLINNNSGCKKCSGSLPPTQIEAEEKVLKKCKEKNYTLVYNLKYENALTKLHLKCNIDDHEWLVSYDNFINKNSSCPKCNGNSRPTQEEAEERVLQKCKERNYELIEPSIYKNNKTKFHLKCNIDGCEWSVSYANFVNRNSGCPKCNESKGEYKIAKILKKNNIKFIQQMKFEKCKNKRCLPFDFYLPEKNILIEYDGKQHYELVVRFGGENGFIDIKNNDNIKTKFAENNKITLIRISYLDNIEKILQKYNLLT